ncbi:unnamed protein product [Chondrus crispus]|uniref:Uncharacterized protein n=1 Tax=Chondrus crispus TaxID=2769 RepID=R7QRT7_CHOCR|nr:unnamed protein product [Chondrus crispus]CDF40854.1 unnamed protein product [Chondrus crispus]|eukprot:XP_005711148.1 unnamed protein product [Chondrus crispus]
MRFTQNVNHLSVALRGIRSLSSKQSTVDPAEVAKFAATAAKWWHPDGSAAPLHRMNPTRVAYIRSVVERNMVNLRGLQAIPPSSKPLTGISLVDVGCGGELAQQFSIT